MTHPTLPDPIDAGRRRVGRAGAAAGGAVPGALALAGVTTAFVFTAGAQAAGDDADDADTTGQIAEPGAILDCWVEFEPGDEFDLDDAEWIDAIDLGPSVTLESGDGLTFADFGEGDGTVTITKDGDDISIATEGDVELEELSFDDLEGEAGVVVEVIDADDLPEGAEVFELDDLPDGVEVFELDELPEGVEVLELDDLSECDDIDIDGPAHGAAVPAEAVEGDR